MNGSNHLFTTILLCTITCFGYGCGESSEKSYTERMADQHADDTAEANESASLEPAVEVTSGIVVYADQDGNEIVGYKSEPVNKSEETPGIIVIHEWWGMNENIETMTRRIAGEGYVALAVDLYDGEAAATPEDARKLMEAAMANPAKAADNLRQARSYLEEEAGVDRTGVIGWCFGGTWSLNTALDMTDGLEAAVIYYGHLNNDPEALKNLEIPILGIFGADDEGIPAASVHRFESILDSLDKEAEIHIYEGAGHAFANPSGNRYKAEAASDAWNKTVRFLNEHVKN